MTDPLPFRVILAMACLLFFAGPTAAQDCNDPMLLCSQAATDTVNTNEGFPSSIAASFCMNEAPNAVFFQFSTLNTDEYTFIEYLDSTATIFLSIDSCITDTLYGQGLDMVIFEASDICDATTYEDPLFCTVEIQSSLSAELTGLLPSTTYYVMVTGLFGPPPAELPSECAFNLDVQGPAVTYDLEPEPNPNEAIVINPGQTAAMAVTPEFEPYEWAGEGLDGNTAPEVVAAPTDFGVYPYTVQTEIDGCPYGVTFTVILLPPITPYNAFTPNSDGFNDTWEVDRIQQFPNAQVVVYSRWGTKVFQATNYREDWDGDDLPAATYYYVIELNDPDNFDAPPITGSVTILR